MKKVYNLLIRANQLDTMRDIGYTDIKTKNVERLDLLSALLNRIKHEVEKTIADINAVDVRSDDYYDQLDVGMTHALANINCLIDEVCKEMGIDEEMVGLMVGEMNQKLGSFENLLIESAELPEN